MDLAGALLAIVGVVFLLWLVRGTWSRGRGDDSRHSDGGGTGWFGPFYGNQDSGTHDSGSHHSSSHHSGSCDSGSSDSGSPGDCGGGGDGGGGN